jgi:hypothetical protein
MEVQVIVAIVGVAAALLGSAIGGFTSYLSTRSMKKLEWKLSLREKELARSEGLYSEFIAEANRVLIQSFDQKFSSVKEMTTLLALESRIWMHSEEIGILSRQIVSCVLDYHTKDRKDEEARFPGLRDTFIATCRRELTSALDGA